MPEPAVLYRGRVFELVREAVTLPNGHHAALEIIRHPGAAAVVALTGEKEVLLLHQYRHAVGGFIWEIPAGTLEKEESPLACAQRELVEEAGFSAQSWQTLTVITPVPGYSTECVHLFLATDLETATQSLDKDEVIEVHRVPWSDALEMARDGRIRDAKTLCGLFLVFACQTA